MRVETRILITVDDGKDDGVLELRDRREGEVQR